MTKRLQGKRLLKGLNDLLQKVRDFIESFEYRAIGLQELGFEEIVTDSREAGPKKAFAAIKGSRFDGHDFIEEAHKKGSRVFFIDYQNAPEVEKKYLNWLTNSCFLFMEGKKTEEALVEAAKTKARSLSGEIVGITGSSGKTTVKEMLEQLLSPKFEVFKARKSFNTPLGLSVEILNARLNADFYLFEFGARKSGDIDELLSILKPTKAILTNVGYAHLGIFGSRDEIYAEKIKLAKSESVREVYLNGDDDYFARAKNDLKQYCCRVFSAGKSPENDLVYEILSVDEVGYPDVKFYFRKEEFRFKLSVPGIHNVSNLALAGLLALKNGVERDDFLKAAAEIRLPKMRLELVQRGNFLFINDAYNSNPASLKSALEFLFTFRRDVEIPKVAIIGDMLELGEYADVMHEEAGKSARALGVDVVIYNGTYFESFKKGFGEENLYKAESAEEAAEILKELGLKEAVVLLKASRALQLERVLEHV